MNQLSRPLDKLLNLFFPSRCPVCGSPSDSYPINPLCMRCWRTVSPYRGPGCSVCGIPTVSTHTIRCGECLESPPAFSRLLFFGIYEGVLREAIHLLKFGGIRRLARPLSGLLATLEIPHADGIVAVPLHREGLLEREFNQTAVMGRYLAKKTGHPLFPDVLRKTKKTPPQTMVSGKERLRNVKGAYEARRRLSGERIILVDDVVTTGATARECAAALIKGGAGDVTVVCVARSMPRL